MKIVLFALILTCTFFSIYTDTAIATESEEVITAGDLFQAYKANSATTREKYLNRRIQIDGVVLQTYMSRYMTPNVDLSDRAGGEVMAICVLSRLDMGKLTNYTPGQTATFSGRVHAFGENRIIIKDTKPME